MGREGDVIDCGRCHGDGTIAVGGYSVSPFSGVSVRDPQEDRDARCPECHGEGTRAGWFYDLALEETEFSAADLGAALRIATRLAETIREALERDPDVVELLSVRVRATGSRRNFLQKSE